jgi:hypothetical protein
MRWTAAKSPDAQAPALSFAAERLGNARHINSLSSRLYSLAYALKGHDKRLSRIASVRKLRCLGHERLLPIRRSASITLLSIFLPIGYGFRKLAVHGVECQAMAAKY